MHSKFKGNIGAFALSLFLAENGYSVFTEEGDISKVDIIAEKNGKLTKFQAKSVTPVDGKISAELRKCGPNYVYRYTKDDFDHMSLYDLENKKLYIVSSEVLFINVHSVTLSLEPPKIKNQKVKLASDFLAEKFLTS